MCLRIWPLPNSILISLSRLQWIRSWTTRQRAPANRAYNSTRLSKQAKFIHQVKWLTTSQIQQKFLQIIREIDEMGTIDSYGGRNNIGGHWCPPTSSTNSTRFSIFVVFLSTVFQVPNFQGRFEALNDVF
jgi:hypothetical protein